MDWPLPTPLLSISLGPVLTRWLFESSPKYKICDTRFPFPNLGIYHTRLSDQWPFRSGVELSDHALTKSFYVIKQKLS